MSSKPTIFIAAAGAIAAIYYVSIRKRWLKLSLAQRLSDFTPSKTLKANDMEFVILGRFPGSAAPALILIRRTPFHEADTHLLLRSLNLQKILQNDIYTSYLADVSWKYKPFKVDVIYPATDSHIQKHTQQDYVMVTETPNVYNTIVKPYIASIPVEKLEWVYNILEHKSESERILYEDTDSKLGFILLPDFKWSNTTKTESLYCLAIVHDRTLRSIRDLTAEHLPLLENIRASSLEFIQEKFKIPLSSLRVYLHYQPTYYHLHVHISHISIQAGTQSGKAVSLNDVMYSLARQSDHYVKATMEYVLGKAQHATLYNELVANRILS